jgi:hypothetical protein
VGRYVSSVDAIRVFLDSGVRESALAVYQVYFNDPSIEWCSDLVMVQFESPAQTVRRRKSRLIARDQTGSSGHFRGSDNTPLARINARRHEGVIPLRPANVGNARFLSI